MGKYLNERNKLILYKFIIVAVFSLIVGFLGEVISNYKVLRLPGEEKGKHYMNLESLYTEGFQYIDGKLVMVQTPGMIRIDQPANYVSKLYYSFTYGWDFNSIVRVFDSEEAEANMTPWDIVDGNNLGLEGSGVIIEDSVQRIDLIFNENTVTIAIDSIYYDNSFNFSMRRMITVTMFAFVISFLLVFRKLLVNRLEYVFLVLAGCTCFAMVFTFPTQKVSWDEAYHFWHSYTMGIGNEIVVTPEINYMGDDGAVSTLLYPKTEEEYEDIEGFLRDSDIYNESSPDNQVLKTSFGPLSNVGHIPSSIGISLGRLFGLPLSTLYYIGKLFNALCYIGVTFFAIRKATMGKRILTVMALMPTPLFLASTYSYDAMLNAFAFLGLATFFAEYSDREKHMSWKSYIIFLVSVAIASAIKMVYAPLLLLLLILPKDKFKDKKTMIIMKYGIFVFCFIILAVMLLPTLLSPSQAGDSRGGNTSDAGQLAFILGSPVAYAKILIYCFVDTAISYLVGPGAFGTMAHCATNLPGSGIITVILVVATLTDPPKIDLGKKAKLFIAAIIGLIICFVWTALYINFTPVGHWTINGVQGRYFIPIIYPLLLLFSTSKIKCELNPKIQNAIMFIIPLILAFSVIGYRAFEFCM